VSTPDLHDELSELAADLRTWVGVQRGDFAEIPKGPGPGEAQVPSPTGGDVVEASLLPDPAPPSPSLGRQPDIVPAPVRGADRLAAIVQDIGDCTRCKLHEQRTNIVFGVGSPDADIVFVGEGPGYNEDQQGEPFVGKAGELLTAIIENVVRLPRDEVYICNVVKCRPPDNRDPEADEVATCSPFLWEQLEALQPRVVVGLGRFAVQTLLETTSSISRLRGRVHPFRGVSFVPTYHPAYLLRNPADKRKVLEDMKLVRTEYERATGRTLAEPLTRQEAGS